MESHEDDWFCPNCGRRAETEIGELRLISCGYCSWTFDVRLDQPIKDAKRILELRRKYNDR